MATGYLVTLGNGSLDSGDAISGTQSTFSINQTIGAGSWTWTGVYQNNGTTYNGITDTGTYYKATDGNVYFVPDNYYITSGTATANSTPSYTDGDGIVTGTAAGDVIDSSYSDSDGDLVTPGGDTVNAGGGNDTIDAGLGDDTVDGGTGADSIYGGQGEDSLTGGDGDDTIYGDDDGAIQGEMTSLNWANQTDNGTPINDEDSILSGFNATSANGDIDIAVSITAEENFTSATMEKGDPLYDFNGVNDTSSIELFGGDTGAGQNASTMTFDFSSNDPANISDEVTNVEFGIHDLDELTGQFLDQVIITAFDANNVAVAVTLTAGDPTTISVNNATGTATAIGNSGGAGNTNSLTGFLQVNIAGPVARIVIDYNNVDTAYGNHAIRVGDLQFETIPLDNPANNSDTIEGGDGNDDIFGGTGDDSIDGGANNDEVYGGDGADRLGGGTGADTLYGGDGADSITAGSGADTVTGGEGDDTVSLGAGDDTFGDWSTDAGNDTVYGDAGDDSINGGAGDDEIYGGADDDTLTGAAGDDTLYGGDGDDLFQITDDHEGETIVGGEDGDNLDVDVVNFSNYASTQGVTVTATGDEAGTFAFDGTPGAGTYVEIEGIEGTQFDDTLNLGADDSGIYVDAEEGDDSITTGDGDDTILAGQGTDTINAGAGNDQIDLGEDSPGNPDQDPDVIILQDGFGDDVVTNFDAPTPNGDGTFTGIDTLDVTALFDLPAGDPDRTPVLTNDVTVTDDGSGNALLTFPNGESITLVGISPTDADNPFYLNAIGIPLPDGTVEGTSGADVINGSYTGDPDGDLVDAGDAILPGDTNNDDLIYGYGGDDRIYSGSGDDEVYGGTGSDLIQSGSGDSTLDGGIGNDTINSGSGDDTVYGGTGDDLVGPSIGSDEVYGGDGNDTLSAGGFAGAGDTLDGGADDDTITGGSGNDAMYGGTGNDSLTTASTGGTDTIEGGEDVGNGDIDTLTFTDNNGPDGVDVSMTGNEAGNYTFPTESGNGTFTEIEQFTLTDQNDTFDGTAATGGNTVDGGAGDDVLTGSLGNDSFTGGDGNDTLNANEGDDELNGGAGDDTIYGDEGEDVIVGGADNDALYGGADNDTIDGGTGDDTVEGGDGDDTLVGGDGADTIIGGADQDVIYGGAGDVINGSESGVDNDTLVVSGVDYIDYDTNPENGIVYFEGGGSLTFTNIENVIVSDRDGTVSGTAGNDVINSFYTGDPDGDMVDNGDAILVGDAGDDDLIYGYDGNDQIETGAGDDEVYGGDGSDFITVSGGSNTVFGGQDSDSVVVGDGSETSSLVGGEDIGDGDFDNIGFDNSISGQGVNVTLTGDESGTYDFAGTSGSGTFSEFEFVTGSIGDDTFDLSGDTNGATVNAAEGSDTIVSGSGDDTILLGADGFFADGEDEIVLTDGFGNDTIQQFEAPTDNGDGTFTGIDTFDVTALNDAGGDPVNTNDVTVTDDGAGNAVLTFPNLESVTLVGISPTDADNPFYLEAIGIPLPDGTVSGTAGNDLIDGSYTGDPDGDMVDAGDAILTGHAANDDLIEAGAGGDTIIAGVGDDTVYAGSGDDLIDGGTGDDTLLGETGDDTFQVGDNHGSDIVTGGEDVGDDDEDVLDLYENGSGQGVTVTFDGDESGTYDFDGTTSDGTFSEIEAIDATNEDDTVDASLDDSGIRVLGNQGNDSITGGSGDDILLGGDDDDTITGGEGADRLSGGLGNDEITFAEGDSVTGGGGSDLFILEDLGEPTNGTITIDGGFGDEATDLDGAGPLAPGDTLRLGTGANLTQAVRDTFVDDGTGSYSGSITLDDGTILNFSEIENIICFTPGTRIATAKGLVAIEDLEVGDLVVTRDHGLQPIRWIEGRSVPAVDRFAPVRIRPNVLAGQERDLLVSPQHRVLFQGYRAELLFGESEVLVSAKHLVDGIDVTQDEQQMVTYVHMMFDQHEIIYAEGAATESFHPGDIGFSAVSDAAREELFAIFPELRADQSHYGATARRCLKKHEAKLIRT